jgi:hypothetical protein
MCAEPQLALAKARSICQEYGLDAVLQPLPGGEIAIAIVDPNKPRQSVLDAPQDILQNLESELKNNVSSIPLPITKS